MILFFKKILKISHTHTHTHTNLLELINEFSKVARYKLNRHKSVAFLHTSNEQSEKEILKNNFIYNSINKSKIFRKKFNQQGKTLVC